MSSPCVRHESCRNSPPLPVVVVCVGLLVLCFKSLLILLLCFEGGMQVLEWPYGSHVSVNPWTRTHVHPRTNRELLHWSLRASKRHRVVRPRWPVHDVPSLGRRTSSLQVLGSITQTPTDSADVDGEPATSGHSLHTCAPQHTERFESVRNSHVRGVRQERCKVF